ncbi:AAA family ATPase [Abiotrophia defectiva]|uniref:AAA family ATPase n=1 Tax=Abiotrophia defectiva TaxID=46125 RepID=UPI0028EE5942|nr:AAA family ATPase [Abiotrophia defectiva]
MTIKIASLTTENVKRVKSVHIEPSPNGLTIIGGNNNNGKTSILDSIAWALGGNKYRPSKAQREGSVVPPTINLKLSNGLIVERKGKNSDLKVTDPTGNKAGQNLLDSFVEELAINLPKFINSSDKEKANTLLEIIGVGQQLYELECQEKEKYNMRRSIGQIADQKEKFAKEQPFYPEAPKTLVSITDLITQQQDILAKNGENQRKRDMTYQLHRQATQLMAEIERQENTLANLKEQYQSVLRDYDVAQKTSEQLQDESTGELEESIANIEAINIKVRANLDREKAEQDAAEYRTQYSSLTTEIESLRKQRMDLLQNADLPLEGLSVEDGELLYNGQRWDNMSGSQQLMVSTAIVRKLKPECGFVLIDKLEQMDMQTLNEFGAWLEQEGLQAIATRVSTGDECSIIIEDGYVKNSESAPAAPPTPKWEAGKF